MDLSDVTVVILSRGRERELVKTLKYWASINISVLLLHNTENPIEITHDMPNLKYVISKVSYGERCGLVQSHLETPYAILCSDDEVYIPSALAKMRELLEDDPDLISVGGLTIAVGMYGPMTTGNFTYSKMHGYSNLGNSGSSRLKSHFDLESGYRNGAIYRLMRKELMNSTMKLFSQLSDFSTPYIFEVTGEIFVNSQGKTSYIDNVYWLRNWMNRPVGHTNWDRKLYFKDWVVEEAYQEQSSDWKNMIQTAIGIQGKEFENIIEKIIQVRGESETNEIKNNKRRKISIPENLKWLIRIALKPRSLPKSLELTLDEMETSGVVVDRKAISFGLSALK